MFIQVRFNLSNLSEKEKIMTTNEIKKTARLAGGLTLLMAVIAIISMVFLPTNLIAPGDATTTATSCTTT